MPKYLLHGQLLFNDILIYLRLESAESLCAADNTPEVSLKHFEVVIAVLEACRAA